MPGNMRLAFTAVLLLFGIQSSLVQAQAVDDDICIDICVTMLTFGFPCCDEFRTGLPGSCGPPGPFPLPPQPEGFGCVPFDTPSPIAMETPSPASFQTFSPTEGNDGNALVEVGTQTTVTVIASAYDTRPGADSDDIGCGDDGCKPSLIHDGITEDEKSRWTCSKDIVPDGGQCEIEFTFGSPQDLMDIEVAFWKGNERTRSLKVKINGDTIGTFDSFPGFTFNSFDIEEDGVTDVTLESVGIAEDEFISLLEVRFMVEPFTSLPS